VEKIIWTELWRMFDCHQTAPPHAINVGKERTTERMLVLWFLDVVQGDDWNAPKQAVALFFCQFDTGR
jgi:hypothetical protein